MYSASDLDLVTVDAFGTLLELVDPHERLADALAARGIERGHDEIGAAFAAEVAYYLPRSHEGRDDESLAQLRRDCTAVFLAKLDTDLPPDEFAPSFVGALEFRPVAGARGALDTLHGCGLALACVANWDVSLAEHLGALDLAPYFGAVVTSADAGTPKPDPAVFRLALERAGAAAARALHIGDENSDREGAAAAGLAFEPAPLATLPARLGLGTAR